MASGWDILGGVGGGLTDYVESKNAQEAYNQNVQAKQQAQTDAGEEHRLSLLERAEHLKLLRQQLEQNLIKSNPNFQYENEKVQTAKKLKDAGDFWLANYGVPLPKEIAASIQFGADVPKELIIPPRPVKPPSDPKLQLWNDLSKQFPEMNTPANRDVFFGLEKKGGEKSDEDKAIGRKLQEIALVEKRLGRKLTDEEYSGMFGVKASEETKDAAKAKKDDAKAAAKVKQKLTPQLASLRKAELFLDQLDKTIDENGDIIGPVMGRIARSPYHTARQQKVKTEFDLSVANAITATKAGARGFGPLERKFFESLSGGIEMTPPQDKEITKAWRTYIENERQSHMEEAETYGIDPAELEPILGHSVPTIPASAFTPKAK